MRLVIIGGGITGTTAAEEVRKLDPEAEITILSEEFHPLYSRVLLPHYVNGKVSRERVFLKKPEWYSEKNIDWQPGVVVKAIDTNNKFVHTSEDREIEYDKLLIATGSDVRTIGDDMREVSYWRTLDDTDHLMELLNGRNPDDRAVVFGSGFIACEYINTFAHYRIPTTVISRGPWFWSKIISKESGTLINAHLAARGVVLYPNSPTPSISPSEKGGVRITLRSDSTRSPLLPEGGPGEVGGGISLDACLIGIGVGMQPELSLMRDAGIEVNEGVKTNEYLETNVPDVYAAGDVAEFMDVTTGRERVAGNHMNAQMQGRAVAKTICGEKTRFELVSSQAINVLDLEIIFIGDTDRNAADSVEVQGSAREGAVSERFIRGGKLVGAVLINKNTERAAMTAEIRQG